MAAAAAAVVVVVVVVEVVVLVVRGVLAVVREMAANEEVRVSAAVAAVVVPEEEAETEVVAVAVEAPRAATAAHAPLGRVVVAPVLVGRGRAPPPATGWAGTNDGAFGRRVREGAVGIEEVNKSIESFDIVSSPRGIDSGDTPKRNDLESWVPRVLPSRAFILSLSGTNMAPRAPQVRYDVNQVSVRFNFPTSYVRSVSSHFLLEAFLLPFDPSSARNAAK